MQQNNGFVIWWRKIQEKPLIVFITVIFSLLGGLSLIINLYFVFNDFFIRTPIEREEMAGSLLQEIDLNRKLIMHSFMSKEQLVNPYNENGILGARATIAMAGPITTKYLLYSNELNILGKKTKEKIIEFYNLLEMYKQTINEIEKNQPGRDLLIMGATKEIQENLQIIGAEAMSLLFINNKKIAERRPIDPKFEKFVTDYVNTKKVGDRFSIKDITDSANFFWMVLREDLIFVLLESRVLKNVGIGEFEKYK